MTISKLPFLFLNDVDTVATPPYFIIHIPKNISSKVALLTCYAREGNFPSYFGYNWDALLDCLRDLSWINQKRIIIFHDDLPLLNDERGIQIYLKLLKIAVDDWKNIKKESFAEPPDKILSIEHELLVLFPPSEESVIAGAFDGVELTD